MLGGINFSEAVLLAFIGVFQTLAVAFLRSTARKEKKQEQKARQAEKKENDERFSKIFHSIEIYNAEIAKVKIDINDIKDDIRDIKQNAFRDKVLHAKYLKTLEDIVDVIPTGLGNLKNAAFNKGNSFIKFCRNINNTVIGLNISQTMTKADIIEMAMNVVRSTKEEMKLYMSNDFIENYFNAHNLETIDYLNSICSVIFNDSLTIENKKKRFNNLSLSFLQRFLNKMIQVFYETGENKNETT